MKRSKSITTALAAAFLLVAAIGVSQSLYAQCVAPPTDMVDWWPLDETVGPTADDIAGSVNNSGTWTSGPVPVNGKVAGALSFSGANSVDVPDHPELNFGTGDYSIDLWIKTTDASAVATILDKRTGPSPSYAGYTLYLYNGSLGSQIGDGNGFMNRTSPGFVADGNWHHVAVTMDRDNPQGWLFYVDGSVAGVPANPTAYQGSVTNTAPLAIGRNLISPSDDFSGTIDEVELFNRVLDSSEVYAIWAAGSAGKCKTTLGIILNEGTLTINGTLNADSLLLRLDATGQIVEIDDLGTPAYPDYTFQFALVDSIHIVTAGGDDWVVFAHDNGPLADLRPLYVDMGPGTNAFFGGTGGATSDQIDSLPSIVAGLNVVILEFNVIADSLEELAQAAAELVATDGVALVDTAEAFFAAALQLSESFQALQIAGDSEIVPLINQFFAEADSLLQLEAELRDSLYVIADSGSTDLVQRLDQLADSIDMFDDDSLFVEELADSMQSEIDRYTLALDAFEAWVEEELSLSDTAFQDLLLQLQQAGDAFHAQADTVLVLGTDALLAWAEENLNSDSTLAQINALEQRADLLRAMTDSLSGVILAVLGNMFDTAASPPITKQTPPVDCSFETTNTIMSATFMWGTKNNDLMIGTSGMDVMFGRGGSDRMYGRDGTDLMWGDLLRFFAPPGPDDMYGEGGIDFMFGNKGNDCMYGGDDIDLMCGNTGDDYMQGNEGRTITFTVYGITISFEAGDIMFGDAGNDEMYGDEEDVPVEEGLDIMSGGAGADIMHGNDGIDLMWGREDGDIMYGEAGKGLTINGASVPIGNFMWGHTGDDQMWGGIDMDYMSGGDGDDIMHGGDAIDIMRGKDGNDEMYGDAGMDAMFGNAGNDKMSGGANTDGMCGNVDNDEMYGDAGFDFMFGGDGDDNMHGGDATDLMCGNSGNDKMFGDDGVDGMSGGEGNDRMSGGNQADFMLGNRGDDCMDGNDGKDWMWGNRDMDRMFGGNDNDRMWGDESFDFMNGDAGNDFMCGGDNNDKMNGNDGNDGMLGWGGDDEMNGGAGLDVMCGNEGDDNMHGDADTDVLWGNGGNDEMYGDGSFDIMTGNDGNDRMDGGDGDDFMRGKENDDVMFGSSGRDIMRGNVGNDRMDGGNDNDYMFGNRDDDIMFGNLGADWMLGGEGQDCLDGGDDNDVMLGRQDNDRMFGGNGAEKLMCGNEGDDCMGGGAGNDRHMYGNRNNDTMNGNDGNDRMYGNRGRDTMDGNDGNDRMYGNRDDDEMYGGLGDDFMRGNRGNDVMYGGSGTDNMKGGLGTNTVVQDGPDGSGVTCTPCAGTVTITKNTVDGDGIFSYSGTGPFSNFTITTTGGTGSQTFANVEPGNYTVTEVGPSLPWSFTSLACIDPDGGTIVSGQTAYIDLDPGETVVATYTNTKDGTCVEPPGYMTGWWPMDETSGSIVYEQQAGWNNDGTTTPGPIGPTGPVSVPAVVSTGFSFPAQNWPRHVIVGDHPDLNFGTDDFTIDAWIKPESQGLINPIVCKLGDNSTGYRFYIIDGVLCLKIGCDGSYLADAYSTSPVTFGVWSHVAVTVNRDSWRDNKRVEYPVVTFYINGAPAGSGPTGSPLMCSIDNPIDLWIGNSREITLLEKFGEIAIDELELFKRELSPLELQSIYDAGSFGKCTEGVGDYIPGDANNDGGVNVGDAVYLINFVFKGGPPPEPIESGDANCDCDCNVGDAVYLINYVFKGGPAPGWCNGCQD